MCRLLTIVFLLAGTPHGPQEEETVKPHSVQTKKVPDTQLFITTVPKGAKVVVEGEEVGPSPHLFVVPAGAKTMLVEVDLGGYETDLRRVEIHGGKIKRVTFELKTPAAPLNRMARATVEAFLKAMASTDSPEAPAKAGGLSGKRRQELREMCDLKTIEIDRVFATGTQACAVSTSFSCRDGGARSTLGFRLTAGENDWTVRDVELLSDYEAMQRFVESFRRRFPLAVEEPTEIAAVGKTAAALDPKCRDVAMRYGQALAAADEEALKEFWKLEDPLDREAADLVVAVLRRERLVSERPGRIELVHCARVGEKLLTAAYFTDSVALFGAKPSPIFQHFTLEDGRWRTLPIVNLRTLAHARTISPEALGRRALVRRLMDFRFGATSLEEKIAVMRAQALASKALSEPPYNMSMFEGTSDAIDRDLEKFKKVANRPWSEIEEVALLNYEQGVDVGSPDDFVLVFYLEALSGQKGREIHQADGEGSFLAERLPCLTDEEIAEASVVREAERQDPAVQVSLTDFGTTVMKRITKEHVGRRIAIVVEGKVISAPHIQAEIPGGRALITGSFSHAEAEELAARLNAYRETCRKVLESLHEERFGTQSATEGTDEE